MKRFNSCIEPENIQFPVNHFYHSFFSLFSAQFSFYLMYRHSDASVFNNSHLNRWVDIIVINCHVSDYDFAPVAFGHSPG